MHAVRPPPMYILMTVLAITIHHQRIGTDELTIDGTRQGGKKVRLATRGSGLIPPSRVLNLNRDGDRRQQHRAQEHIATGTPADAFPCQPVEHEQPNQQQRCDHVCPIGECACGGIA